MERWFKSPEQPGTVGYKKRELSRGLVGFVCALVLTGCSLKLKVVPLNLRQSIVSPSAPVTPVPLTGNVWNLIAANSSTFEYDNTKIDFNGPGGICELMPLSQTDDLNNTTGTGSAGFDGGSFSGLAWDSTNHFVRLSNHGGCNGTSAACANQIVPSIYELSSAWTPKWSSIKGYWKLNGSGSVSTGASVPATVGTGGIAGNTNASGLAYVQGQVGTGLVFDGTDDYVSVADPTTYQLGTGDFAFQAWFKSTAGGLKPLFGQSNGAGDSYGMGLNAGAASFSTFHAVGAISNSTTTSGTYNDGVFHHLVVTRVSGTILIYIDGKFVTSQANASSVNPGGSFAIARIGSTPGYFNGTLDDIAFWNVGLSADDVVTLYTHQAPVHSGAFVSRVMDGILNGSNWTSLSWKPTLPFQKEIPLTNETQAGYSALVDSGGVSGDSSLATGLAALWHLDEPVGTVVGTGTVKDSSSNGFDGDSFWNMSFGSSGVLNSAVTTTAVSGMIFPLVSTQTTSITMSIWVYMTATAVTGPILYYNGNTNTDGYGLFVSDGGTQVQVLLGGVSGNALTAGSYSLSLNQWTHLALVQSGTVWTLYANGTSVATGTGTPVVPTLNTVISHPAQGFPGRIDEAAFWNRALDPKEILGLYRRGANRIKYQVRSCSATNCTDDPSGLNWQGPDGTNSSYYSELNSTATYDVTNNVPTGAVSASAPSMTFANFSTPTPAPNRYFQYRAVLESDDTGTSNCTYDGGTTHVACSPELKSTNIGPDHYDPSAAPTVITHTGINYHSLSGAVETLGTGSCSGGGVLYNLGVGTSYGTATWYWWTAGTWVAASGTSATANLVSNLTASSGAALAAFGSQVSGTKVYLKAFLQSSGLTPCQLNTFEIDGLY